MTQRKVNARLYDRLPEGSVSEELIGRWLRDAFPDPAVLPRPVSAGSSSPGLEPPPFPPPPVHPEVTLADIIRAGVLVPPVKLFRIYRGTKLEATLLPDGKVEFHQHVYDTCSAAGEAARNSVTGKRHNTNGWTFWQYQGVDGNTLQLRDARSQLEPPPSEDRHAGGSA
jgi:hypothetical protein